MMMHLLGRTGLYGGQWFPTDIGDCVLWLSSDLGITKDAEDRVNPWADQSVNGNDASQAVDAKKFVWYAGPPSYVRGDHVDDLMTFTHAFVGLGTQAYSTRQGVVVVPSANFRTGGRVIIADTHDMAMYGRVLSSAEISSLADGIDRSGMGRKTYIGITQDSTVYHRIDSVSGPYTIRYVGNNGVIYEQSLNDVTTDLAAQGLTAPYTMVIPDAVRLDPNVTQFRFRENALSGLIPDLSSNTALQYFQCYNNQLTGYIPDLSSNTALLQFACDTNQLMGSIPNLSSNTALTLFTCSSNQLIGSIPDLSSNTELTLLHFHNNQLTGSIPDLSSNTKLQTFYCYTNQLTGSIPDLSRNTALTKFHFHFNQLTGSIPDLSSNTALTQFYCHVNQLTGYVGSGFSATLKEFKANVNDLSEAAVNNILIHLDTAGATNGTCSLDGGTNAAPTGDGATAKTNLIGKGWIVNTN